MKKTIWSKISSAFLILSMVLGMLPVTSFPAAAEAIRQAGSHYAIPDLDPVIEEKTPEMAAVVAFAEGLTPGYGSNCKFLAPIEDPDPDAIKIYTAEDLDNVRNDLSSSYVLMNDIDLADFSGGQWVPIGDNSTGNDSSRFTGSFDGQGHVIRNLTITGDTLQYAGLFGYVNGAILENMGLEETYINVYSSSSYAVGICGCTTGSGTISNCYNAGDISATSSASSSPSSSQAGGICSNNNGSVIISNSYNTGDISATSSSSSSFSYAGGIYGYSVGSAFIISKCITFAERIYAENTVNPANIHSYLVGYGGTKTNNLALEGVIDGDPFDDATRRISTVEAKDQATYEEELGWDFEDVWQMVEGYDYPQLRGLPSAELSTDATLASLSILDSDESMLFPEFNINVTSHTTVVPYGIDKVIIAAEANHPGASISGTGEQKLSEVGEYRFEVKVTAEDGDTVKIYTITITRQEEVPIDLSKFLAPIEPPDPSAKKIYTAQQLHNVRNDLNSSYMLMNDIDLADWGEWEPIGNNSTDDDISKFIGIFDGQGYAIKNLSIAGDTYQYTGLFGCINSAEIKNVGLEDTNINVFSGVVGGICGYSYSSTINNCYNTGGISASSYSSSAGGICGFRSGSISNCYNTGDIFFSSTEYYSCAGGICGDGFGSISNCYNTGNISSSSNAGGICGDCSESISSSISNCYNTGYISSFSSFFYSLAGGICCISSAPISNCYNTGDISSSSSYYSASYAGGICCFSSGSISNCYNTGDISSYDYLDSYAGGVCGDINSPGTISNCVTLSKLIYAEASTSANAHSYLISSGEIKKDNLALEGDVDGSPINDANGFITQVQAEDQFTYEIGLDWDFVDVWQMVPGYKYPQLRGMPPAGPGADIKYTVTFEAGDHGTMDPTLVIEKVGYDETVTILPSIKENTGHIFAGWESSLGGIYDSDAVGLYRVRADVTFTARYADAEKATVIFDYNGGKDLEGNSFLISSGFSGAAYETPVVTKEGYDFAGWDPSPSLKYGEKGISERLTAKWDAKSYIVSFKAGEHGKLDPSDRQEIVKYGKKITLIPSVEANTGFTFIGWECSESHEFYRNSRLKNLPITANTTFIALYAEADKSTVVFDYNGGMDNEGRHFVIINGKPGDEYIAPKPTMVGHTLNSTNNWLPCLVDCTFTEGADPIYYFAQWEVNRYTATFLDDDGSTLLGQVKEIAYGTTVAAGNGGIPDDPTKVGYRFDGWDDGLVTSSDVSKYLVTEHVTFTAKYVEIVDAIVIFDYNGGRDDEGNSSKTLQGKPGDTYDLPVPARDGYILNTPISWQSELSEEPSRVFGEAGSSIIYYAQWKVNRYTATFKDEDGSIKGEVTGIAYRTTVADGVESIPDDPAKSGFVFLGWNDGAGTYSDVLVYVVTGDVTFTAQYRAEGGGGGGGGGDQPKTATLTVRAIDKVSGAVIPPVITTTVLVGEKEKINAPQIPDYDLAEDCQPTQEVTIVAGNNTVNFFYNKKAGLIGPDGSTVSDKIKEVLETQEHISYINGYPDGSVKPDNNITRAEVAIIFWRLLKSLEKNDPVTAALSDIKGDESYAQAVKYLAKMGILLGYEDGSFRPSRGITRAEFVAISCRFDDLENSNSNPFTDLTGSHWAYSYIISAYVKGWISGYPDGEFKPQNGISRAEVVKIVNCMLGRGIKLADLPADLPSYADLASSHWAYCEIMESTVSHEFERQEDGWEIWK